MSNETNRIRYIIPKSVRYTALMNSVASVEAHADSETAAYRLKVIQYYQQFGIRATMAAFPVKRSTVFLWQKNLKKSRGRLSSLVPLSSRPHTYRHMNTSPLVLAEIWRLRRKHYRLGKKKLYPLIRTYCRTAGIPYPAISTIGKIVERNHIFIDKPTYGYHDPSRKRHVQRKNF